MAQLMPLPLTVSCFSKIQIGFTFLVLAHLGSPRKRAVKRACVCVVHEYFNIAIDANDHFLVTRSAVSVTGYWTANVKGVASFQKSVSRSMVTSSR